MSSFQKYGCRPSADCPGLAYLCTNRVMHKGLPQDVTRNHNSMFVGSTSVAMAPKQGSRLLPGEGIPWEI